ncbi:hypothetical protein BH11PSE10_BH11PSE10_17340 [soil metagenome]
MKNMRTRKALGLTAATLLGAAALLSACGGSGSDGPPAIVPTPVAVPLTAVPDSVGLSISSLFTFLLSLSASDETSEPLTISDTFTAATDDTAEPTPL